MRQLNTKKREARIVGEAITILERRMNESRARYQVSRPHIVHEYLRLRLGTLEREVFMVLFVDAQCRILGMEELFQGTLTQTTVHAREVARAALRYNAAAIIIAHNHPSGHCEFSDHDEKLRMNLIRALELIDVQVLDSLLVAGAQIASWAEHQALADFAEQEDDRRAQRERTERRSAAAKAARARHKGSASHA